MMSQSQTIDPNENPDENTEKPKTSDAKNRSAVKKPKSERKIPAKRLNSDSIKVGDVPTSKRRTRGSERNK